MATGPLYKVGIRMQRSQGTDNGALLTLTWGGGFIIKNGLTTKLLTHLQNRKNF